MGKGTADLGQQEVGASVRVTPGMYGVPLTSGTPLYEEARQLLATQFGRVQTGITATPSYVEATATVQDLTIPIAVCQDHQDSKQASPSRSFFGAFRQPKVAAHPGLLLGVARVELAGATLTESMILLKPSSPTAQALEDGTIAEIGSFAVIDGLSKASLLDVIDTIVATAIRIAHERGIEQLWIFPRNGFMSLIRAEIPDLLPPYHFTLCTDVAGWNEESAQLRQFREMRLRGLGSWPDIFSITRSEFEADLAQRLLTLDARRERQDDIERLLPPAMLRAQRTIREEAAAFHRGTRRKTAPPVIQRQQDTAVTAEAVTTTAETVADPTALLLPQNATRAPRMTQAPRLAQAPKSAGFLPFADANRYEGQYLRDVVQRGGEVAVDYKYLSRRFLELESGQRVLDIGCGSGVDLALLSEAVGPDGRVVGVDHNPERVQEARTTVQAGKRSNITVLLANAEGLTFPSGEFDRVRADRVLQHIPRQRAALTEMWRVLAPDGIMSVVEPDWAAIAISPASARAEDDDTTLAHVLGWCRRHLQHPLIGRQLHGLLREQGPNAWQSVDVVARAYSFTDWSTVDTILQLSSAARALMQEQPELADDLSEWLRLAEEASSNGTFFATIPLFFATARKVS